MNRTVGIVVTVVWLIAMTMVVRRDVVPFWAAQEPPAQSNEDAQFQYAIANDAGRRIGTSWFTITGGPQLTTVRSITALDLHGMTGMAAGLRKMVLDTDLIYETGGMLDHFQFVMHGAGLPVMVRGERYGEDFACTAQIGEMSTTFPLDGRLSTGLSETLRPFTRLENIHVGQTWRIKMLDPLATLRGGTAEFTTHLVRVTRRETIRHKGDSLSCFRIEMKDALAWADEAGHVLKQEVQVPFLGRWVITDETFEEPSLQQTLNSVGRGYRGKAASKAEKLGTTKND